MKTYLIQYRVTPRVILRAKQRAKECMSRTKDPEECRHLFELVDELERTSVKDDRQGNDENNSLKK
jgi:K+/H+ antiporter YhaU regulatory subunit KhtT